MSAAAHAIPPATVATCQGIKDAYPILGTQCEKDYATISHDPANAEERLASFRARKSVLQIFQKALLCNGLNDATAASQQIFRRGEEGHLTLLANLRGAMMNAEDPNVPAAFDAADLNRDVKIKKQQCN